MAIHFLLFRCLLEDRLGRPALVRILRKEAFNLMDEVVESDSFAMARRAGGAQKVSRIVGQHETHFGPDCRQSRWLRPCHFRPKHPT